MGPPADRFNNAVRAYRSHVLLVYINRILAQLAHFAYKDFVQSKPLFEGNNLARTEVRFEHDSAFFRILPRKHFLQCVKPLRFVNIGQKSKRPQIYSYHGNPRNSGIMRSTKHCAVTAEYNAKIRGFKHTADFF
jgi:hypothetical protein